MDEEFAFLRNIALATDDDLPRLAFADWLDERGEAARAEFIRVQCALSHSKLVEARRGALRIRERALLEAHRQDWIQSFPLPIEDVQFRRGLLSAMRLRKWDNGKWPDAPIASHFATLEELDLSGLRILDDGLEHFARQADLPALRKILLNGNAITDAGANALANAERLPRLASVYLFDNQDAQIGNCLREAPHFKLTALDLGIPATGYLYSPGQADAARREFLRKYLLPCVTNYFRKHEHLRSAMLCVAQYWADEADDAVHENLIVSELSEPTMDGARNGYEEDERPDPNVPNTLIKREYGERYGSHVDTPGVPWDDNSGAIPLWAAFAPEGGSQDQGDLSESYAPAVMFYRHGGYEILPMLRPHLDGIMPEWH